GAKRPWEKPQAELAAIGKPVRQYVTSALSLRAADAFALDRCVELLVRLDDIAAVRAAYGTSRRSAKPLGHKAEHDPGALGRAGAHMKGEDAEALVGTALAEDPSWKVRAGAAGAALAMADPSPRVQDALVNALADSDWFVATKAAEACGKLKIAR